LEKRTSSCTSQSIKFNKYARLRALIRNVTKRSDLFSSKMLMSSGSGDKLKYCYFLNSSWNTLVLKEKNNAAALAGKNHVHDSVSAVWHFNEGRR